ncbi:MAG: S8 family serine peptidase [Deltaproteobacteria bacterium]|nr:S8 family serine peptidase [Deltaproteobacteria bacterium]
MQSETCLSPASLSYAATVYNHSNGESRLYYFDAGGNITDGEKLILEEKKARYNAIGAMTDGLVAELSGKGESEEVPVWIWGKTYFEYPDKEAILKDQYAPASFEDTVYYEVEFANAAVMDAVTEAGGNADLFVIDAPMVHAYVTKAQLASVSKHPEVAYIFFDYGDGFPTSRTYIDAVDASVVHSWGIYGTNKYVGIQMWNRPDDTSRLSLSGVMNPNGSTSAEATMAAGVVKSNDSGVYWGIAPQSVVYFANMDRTGYSGSYPTAESWALAQGVKVFAYGWSTVNGSGNTVNGHDMYVDWLVKRSPYPLYVGSAGNSNGGDGRACSTNPAYQYVQNHFFNGLVVGGSDAKGTISNLDDTIYSCSSHRNPASSNNDRELPEVVAPAKCIDGGSKTCMDGTSAAASIVAGTAALIMQKNSALSSWPEAMRAVIMASSWTNVDGPALSFSDGTDDKDGIGQVNSAEAVDLADSANKVNGGNPARQKGFDYGTMYFPSSFPNNEYTEVYNIEVPPGGELQVALAWDATAACPRAENSNYDFCDSDRLDANLNLLLFEGINLIGSSSSYDNSYEYLYFKNSSNQNKYLTLKIRLFIYYSASTYFGLAWTIYNRTLCGVLGTVMCDATESTLASDTKNGVDPVSWTL